MSSICVKDLRSYLKNVPDDYEVIMEICTRYDSPPGTAIAFINGIKRNDDFREVRLMN